MGVGVKDLVDDLSVFESLVEIFVERKGNIDMDSVLGLFLVVFQFWVFELVQ